MQTVRESLIVNTLAGGQTKFSLEISKDGIYTVSQDDVMLGSMTKSRQGDLLVIDAHWQVCHANNMRDALLFLLFGERP